MEPTMSTDQATFEDNGKTQKRSGVVGNATHAAAERIHKAADSLREKGTESGAITNRVTGNAASMMDQAATYIDDFSAERFRDDLSDLVRKRPLQSMAVGILFGFFTARFLRR